MINLSNIYFRSAAHQRYEGGVPVRGLQQGCIRSIKIEANTGGDEGYIVTFFNEDGNHPLWGNNVMMSPKPMKVVGASGNIIELRGYGYDTTALAMGVPPADASFANYGLLLLIENGEVERAQLNMYDRNVSIVYLR